MEWRTVAVSVSTVLFSGALAWAAVCPLCLTDIPDSEKYCARHKAEMVAKKMTSQDEKKIVDETLKARQDYQAKLDALAKFYQSRGNDDCLRRVQDEIRDFNESRHFDGINLEDRLTELSAKTPSAEADKLLKEADAIRTSSNPLNRGERLRAAAAKYQEILMKYPTSTAVDHAAYGLGEVYASTVVNEPARAAKYFELAFLANPNTETDALYRAAQISDQRADYENAARFYWMAAKTAKHALTKNRSIDRLQTLQKAGFGSGYVVSELLKEPAMEKKK